MDFVRTPDSQFNNLPDYNFEPHYTTVTADNGTELRIHHIEAGPRDGPLVVLMHGNPSWSFLHRHMVTALAAAGCRAVALDLVGLGRSDKPTNRDDYTLDSHVDWITQWFTRNNIENATLFCQDWGGVIGLIVAAENPERFSGIVAANTGLPEGEGGSEFLLGWIAMMREATTFPWDMIRQGMMNEWSEDVFQGYLAPFPEDKYMMGIIAFPALIAAEPDNPGVPRCKAAWQKLELFDKPVLALFGDSDPISAGEDEKIKTRIPGAKGQPHQTIAGAGHFIQEDYSDQLVPPLLSFIGV